VRSNTNVPVEAAPMSHLARVVRGLDARLV